MRSYDYGFQTALDLRECAGTFQAVGEGLLREHKGKALLGRATAAWLRSANPSSAWGFYTPRADPSPFDALEEQPDFLVGLNLPKTVGAAKGASNRVQMQVWDRGASRSVELYADGSGKAEEILNRFISAFVAADPSIASRGGAPPGDSLPPPPPPPT